MVARKHIMHPGPDTRPIIQAYGDVSIRVYATLRFQILRQVFLSEIEQYLPDRGTVMDLGCGFGLFSMYFALARPDVHFFGMDIDAHRIEQARAAAERLGLTNVAYEQGDVGKHHFDAHFDAAYMLDIVHHIPRNAVEPLLRAIHDLLPTGGRLLIKDVDSRPLYKASFTWLMDKVVDFRTPVHYWSKRELTDLLKRIGFQVHCHYMTDYLPYPHILYICTKLP